MKLTLELLRAAARGCVSVTDEGGWFCFHRFTAEQEKIYNYSDKVYDTAGILLAMHTDSPTLKLEAEMICTSSHSFFAFDVCVNGKRIGSMQNYGEETPTGDYASVKYPYGVFTRTFDLGEGEKFLQIWLPTTATPRVREISLADGASIRCEKPEKKLLMWGDSITQGYDALHPSAQYTALLSEKLGAEGFNKGVGGAHFNPRLAAAREDFTPDYITVAYGTNDWRWNTAEELENNCREFYGNICRLYPGVPVFAITPIWRYDWATERNAGSFADLRDLIRRAVADFADVHVVDGMQLVPHKAEYFGDLALHPSDEGFRHYAENLYGAMRPYIG